MTRPAARDFVSKLTLLTKRVRLIERRLARSPSSLPARLSTNGAETVDWNAETAVGFYWGNDALNGPPGGGRASGEVWHDGGADVTFQQARRTGDVSTLWSRYRLTSGTWTDWSPIYGGDTGWIDLSPYLLSGFSAGAFAARRLGKVVTLRGVNIGGPWSTASVTDFASAIPTQFRPPGNTWGGAYNSAGNYPNSALVRDAGTMALARAQVSGSNMQFTITFMVD